MHRIKLPKKRIEASKERYETVWNFEEPDRVPAVFNTVGVAGLPWNLPCAIRESLGINGMDYLLDPEKKLKTQLAAIRYQLKKVPDDDFIPCLWPAFACRAVPTAWGSKVRYYEPKELATGIYTCEGAWITEPVIKSVEDIDQLEVADPYEDGLLPMLLEHIKYMAKETDHEIPFDIEEIKGPMILAMILRGLENLVEDMYLHPKKVHQLLRIVTETYIEFVKAQFEAGGGRENFAGGRGISGVWCPPKHPICIDGDGATLISPKLYKEFITPYDTKIMKEFGGGTFHCCGVLQYAIEAFMNTEGAVGIQLSLNGSLLPWQSDDRSKQAVEESFKELARYKEITKNKLVLLVGGHIHPTKRVIDILAPGGGFILTSYAGHATDRIDAGARAASTRASAVPLEEKKEIMKHINYPRRD